MLSLELLPWKRGACVGGRGGGREKKVDGEWHVSWREACHKDMFTFGWILVGSWLDLCGWIFVVGSWLDLGWIFGSFLSLLLFLLTSLPLRLPFLPFPPPFPKPARSAFPGARTVRFTKHVAKGPAAMASLAAELQTKRQELEALNAKLAQTVGVPCVWKERTGGDEPDKGGGQGRGRRARRRGAGAGRAGRRRKMRRR